VWSRMIAGLGILLQLALAADYLNAQGDIATRR
jgi:hypothetical protein